MNITQPKILFFTEQHAPTQLDQIEAAELGFSVEFRNNMFVYNDKEPCDAVAGHVPECYKDHPKAADVIKAFKAKVKLARASLADVGTPEDLPDADTEASTWDASK